MCLFVLCVYSKLSSWLSNLYKCGLQHLKSSIYSHFYDLIFQFFLLQDKIMNSHWGKITKHRILKMFPTLPKKSSAKNLYCVIWHKTGMVLFIVGYKFGHYTSPSFGSSHWIHFIHWRKYKQWKQKLFLILFSIWSWWVLSITFEIKKFKV